MNTLQDFIEGAPLVRDGRPWCLLHHRHEERACVWATSATASLDGTVLEFDTSNEVGRAWLAGLQAGCELNALPGADDATA